MDENNNTNNDQLDESLPFILTRGYFKKFVALLVSLFDNKYNVADGKKLEEDIEDLDKNKVAKDGNKVLSTNDYTNEDKEKLDSVDEGAQKNKITAIYYKDSKLEISDEGHVTVPGISKDELPTTLPNAYSIRAYNDAATSVVSYNGAGTRTLTAYSFFRTTVINLTQNSWNSKKCTAAISNLHSESIVFVSPSPHNMSAYAEYGIKAEEIYTGQIHFSCLETPQEDISVYVIYSSPPRKSDGTIDLS